MPFNQLDVDRRTGVILTRLCRFVRELEESSADDDFAERVAAATRASEAAEALSHHVTRHGDEAEPQAAEVPSGRLSGASSGAVRQAQRVCAEVFSVAKRSRYTGVGLRSRLGPRDGRWSRPASFGLDSLPPTQAGSGNRRRRDGREGYVDSIAPRNTRAPARPGS